MDRALDNAIDAARDMAAACRDADGAARHHQRRVWLEELRRLRASCRILEAQYAELRRENNELAGIIRWEAREKGGAGK